jgi:hypothetical protein
MPSGPVYLSVCITPRDLCSPENSALHSTHWSLAFIRNHGTDARSLLLRRCKFCRGITRTEKDDRERWTGLVTLTAGILVVSQAYVLAWKMLGSWGHPKRKEKELKLECATRESSELLSTFSSFALVETFLFLTSACWDLIERTNCLALVCFVFT